MEIAMTKKVLGIVGSLRKESFNKKLAEAARSLSHDFELEIVTLNEIPPFNQDDEEILPSSVQALRKKVHEADGLWFFAPEYNHSIPGGLKNAIDWLSRKTPEGPQVFTGKPVAISGITPGMSGTLLAQDHLVVVLSFLNARIMNDPRLTIPRAFDVIKDNKLVLGDSQKYLERQIDAFAAFIA